jgi:predicted nucleotidyltransferase
MAHTPTDMLPLAEPGPLPDVVAEHLDEIRALCREYGVLRLEVFGSALTPRFDPETSDIDFLIAYPSGHDLGPWMKHHFALKEQLAEILGHPVDLVIIDAIRKPRFVEAIRDRRRLLYAA